MTRKLEVGDLVRDKLNEGDGCYGLGVVTDVEAPHPLEKHVSGYQPATENRRYSVYFNKFERTITFHGDYLEKV